MYQVEFQPCGRRTSVVPGTSLLEAAKKAGVPIESICAGEGTCGKCRVTVLEGRSASLTDCDRRLGDGAKLPTTDRLACRTTPMSDLRVYVPKATWAKEQKLELSGVERPIILDSPIRKTHLTIDEPSSADLRSDLSRIDSAYRNKVNGRRLLPDLAALREVTTTLREGQWSVTVATYGGSELISIDPGDTVNESYGMAIDLGTTKVAAYLIDLVSGLTVDSLGAMNPQIAYGEDVVARAAYILSGADEDASMQHAIVGLLNHMIHELCDRNAISETDILDVTVVGNTVMHHILNRLPVEALVRAPYVPAVSDALNLKARDLGLRIAPGGYVYCPPVVAGFVGADHVAMLLAADIDSIVGNVIAVDIGTNTEMSLITVDGRILTCSCASGPALEGGHIKFGMRAAPGAIEHVVIDGHTRDAVTQTIGGEPAVGICGSGVLEAVAALSLADVVDMRGRLIEGVKGVRTSSGNGMREFVLVPREMSAVDEDIVFTQEDINAVQLAKGAIRSGMETLLGEAGMDVAEVSKFVVAGAFGAHIDPDTAVTIGMFPEIALDRCEQIGNGAGWGAKMMLLSQEWRNKSIELATKKIEYVELTTSPSFSRTFAHSLRLPGVRVA